MPAVVLTIQDMRISINVRKKIAVVGQFAGFCVRFSEWFPLRQKYWSVDKRKKGLGNFATVPKGSCNVCVAIKSKSGMF